jgi:preprotein translocase subunit SecA
MVTSAIERAQKQVEAQNFSVRKHLLEYDDVMNKQRESIYSLRREILEGTIRLEEETVGTREYLLDLAQDILDGVVDTYCGKDVDPHEWDLEALRRELARIVGLDGGDYAIVGFDAGKPIDDVRDALWSRIEKRYTEKEDVIGAELLRRVERDIMLQIVDAQWKDHLYSLDHLKEGIGLRGYGQRDPLVEYKKESYALFQDMKDRVDEEMVRYLWLLRPVMRAAPLTMSGGETAASLFGAPSGGNSRQPARTGGDDVIKTVRREEPKVGRNDPCPCGSGKKYKKCHGAAA